NRSGGANPVTGAGDGHESGQKTIDREADVPLLAQHVSVGHGGEARGAGRESCVGRYASDALEVHRGKRAAWIEAIPAEPQEQSARGGDGQIVGQHRSAAIALEPAAEPRSENDRAGESNETADRVDYRGAGEIVEARSDPRQVVAGAPHQGEETVRAPGPVADDRVDKAGDGDAI